MWLQTPCTTRNREPGLGLTSEDWLQQCSACSALGIVVSSDLQQLAVLGWPATGTTATVDTTPNRGVSPGPGQYNRNKGPSWRSRLRHRQSTRPHVTRRLGATEVSCLCTIPPRYAPAVAQPELMHSTNLGVRRELSAVSDHLAVAWFLFFCCFSATFFLHAARNI